MRQRYNVLDHAYTTWREWIRLCESLGNHAALEKVKGDYEQEYPKGDWEIHWEIAKELGYRAWIS